MAVTAIPTARHGAAVICRDSTLEVTMRMALVDSRQRFKDLVEIFSDFAWETDLPGAFTFVSPSGALGYSAEALVGMSARDLLYHRSAIPSRFAFEARDIVERTEQWLRNADGEAVCVLASARPILDKDGKRTGARGVCRDVTAEQLRESDLAKLKIREQVIAFIVDAVRNEADPQDMLSTAVASIGKALPDTACAVYQREGSGNFTMVAEYGHLPESVDLVDSVNRICTDFSAHEAIISGQHALLTATRYRDDRNGAILLSRQSAAVWSEHDRSLLDAVAGQLGIALRQIENQSELERLSRTDALTGLYNRRAYMEELERALERSRRNGQPGAVFFVDLNNFKAVNDVRGHDVGDSVLKNVAQVLKTATRNYDFAARLGGDEFALWFENIDKAAARRRGLELLRSCYHLDAFSGSPDKRLGLSIGIAMFRSGSDEGSDGLLKRADTAMYRAKHTRKQHLSLARDKGLRDAEL